MTNFDPIVDRDEYYIIHDLNIFLTKIDSDEVFKQVAGGAEAARDFRDRDEKGFLESEVTSALFGNPHFNK